LHCEKCVGFFPVVVLTLDELKTFAIPVIMRIRTLKLQIQVERILVLFVFCSLLFPSVCVPFSVCIQNHLLGQY